MEHLLSRPWELGLVVGIILVLALILGRHTAIRYKIEHTPERKEQMAGIRNGFFFLASLLLGFSLNTAASRYLERRSLLVEEAVSTGTTYLRASTLPEPYRDHSKTLLREYVESRLDLSDISVNPSKVNGHDQAKRIHGDLWLDAATVAQNDRTAVTAAYINSLNQTIDLHEKRVAAFENRIPHTVWFLIVFVSVIATFTRGSTLGAHFWLTFILVPLTLSIVVALIADLDTPSRGLIRLDQRALQRLKVDMSTDAAHPD